MRLRQKAAIQNRMMHGNHQIRRRKWDSLMLLNLLGSLSR